MKKQKISYSTKYDQFSELSRPLWSDKLLTTSCTPKGCQLLAVIDYQLILSKMPIFRADHNLGI